MSDNNTLENLMTENTNIDDTTTLTEEVVMEKVETEETVAEEVATETAEMTETVEETPNVAEEETAEEIIATEEETEPVVEEVPAEVEEQATEETTTTEEVAEEVATETAEMTETVEETPNVAEEKTAEEIIATEEETEPVVEEIPAEVEEQATEETTTTEDVAEETVTPAEEQIIEEVATTEPPTEEVESEPVVEEVSAPVEEVAQEVVATEVAPKKEPFKLTPPENNEELFEKMCVKRGRKLIYAPKEVIYDASFTVLGTNKKNEEGIRVKDILDAEIKEGTRLGYLDKYDGLKTSEIKEEYENDIIYEYAEQEFKKMGIIYDGKKIKVYVYDWDGKACHHVGFIDETAAAESIKYFSDKENYSFDLCGIITGGKGKRVTKNENGKITITKEKGGDYGIELDISVIARKD